MQIQYWNYVVDRYLSAHNPRPGYIGRGYSSGVHVHMLWPDGVGSGSVCQQQQIHQFLNFFTNNRPSRVVCGWARTGGHGPGPKDKTSTAWPESVRGISSIQLHGWRIVEAYQSVAVRTKKKSNQLRNQPTSSYGDDGYSYTYLPLPWLTLTDTFFGPPAKAHPLSQAPFIHIPIFSPLPLGLQFHTPTVNTLYPPLSHHPPYPSSFNRPDDVHSHHVETAQWNKQDNPSSTSPPPIYFPLVPSPTRLT